MPALRAGLGSRKVPQLVMPRTTPPEVRIWLPVVLAILEESVRVGGVSGGGGGEADSLISLMVRAGRTWDMRIRWSGMMG